ncbi:sigma-54 interaction domain-containing protein [Phycisphaerales bacterium AB-hyl4]|uniref:Sigma-54 interaction domain-containing protein n=1 Tax=Natronomicrosphaera hydrolytica TaxID=3242702 RepID=A0ABV4U5M3_9BACT
MDQFRTLLLDVWREACRHIEIERSTETIARILPHRLPVDRLVVFAFDFTQGLAIPRADSLTIPQDVAPPRTLRSPDRRLLEAWCRRHEVILHRLGDQQHDVLRLLAGSPLDGSWLAAPLTSEHGYAGALLLRAHPPAEFEPEHARMVELLIEPFSVALENDHRLHELDALREAAEADKRSALSRLGREDLVDTIVGDDGGLKAVMERAALVARSDLPVLILGETGSGKEVIARAIHEQCPRAKGPFIRVNCGAIPPELIDSELFGHEKGAFTGATASRRGWFERADEGTLLLDEIGELTPAAQVRLLRVLQEGTFERVGAERPIHVNVRIIAATHRDLPAMVQAGQFREDLWYRVAGFPIVLPPLRERKQDIPALATHFAERAARRFGLRTQSPTSTDLSLLTNYDWPGNIRELASVIDRAAILGDGHRLAIAQALGGVTSPDATRPSQTLNPTAQRNTLATLDEATRQHIEATLAATHGRIEGERGAAKLLDINPHTLRARMRKLGVDWAKYR